MLKVGSKAWQEVYAKRVGKAMDILTRGGRRAYWVGNPIMRDPGYRDRISMMDKIYKAEAAKHPGVFYVPTWALFADDEGLLRGVPAGRERRPRAHARADGIHLTRAGGDRMAQAALDVIEKDWGIPQQP